MTSLSLCSGRLLLHGANSLDTFLERPQLSSAVEGPSLCLFRSDTGKGHINHTVWPSYADTFHQRGDLIFDSELIKFISSLPLTYRFFLLISLSLPLPLPFSPPPFLSLYLSVCLPVYLLYKVGSTLFAFNILYLRVTEK